MIKIAALNKEADDVSDSELEVTREALEQIALQQYAKALDLQRKGNITEAMQILKDLLETELLDNVKKPAPGERPADPFFNLKYLCFTNIGSMQSSLGEIDNAIECYCSATELDDTDVSLWHKLGNLCMQAQQYDMALNAYQRGVDRNPRHWPCIDKLVILLLALDYSHDCISVIYDSLLLDPDYARGLVYRRHIFDTLNYVYEYMELQDKKYKWDKNIREEVDKDYAEKLIKEASDIRKVYLEQIKANTFKCTLPILKLRKPIVNLSWKAVGDSLVHMHHYMTEHSYSHACAVQLIYEKEQPVDEMEVCEDPKKPDIPDAKLEEVVEIEKAVENFSENENNEMSDKATTDYEKVESDFEVQIMEIPADAQPQNLDAKEQKKTPVRRRGSALSFLEQWEWCNRRSGRRKNATKQYQPDESIYDVLRRMVPQWLVKEPSTPKENNIRENSPDTMDLYKLFDEKDNGTETKTDEGVYFYTECEQNDVKLFIDKYSERKSDIIDILKEYLSVVSKKWNIKWPNGLANIFVEVNKCYNNHISIPVCTDEYTEELLHYVNVNLLCEEIIVNDKLQSNSQENKKHQVNVAVSIGLMLISCPHIFATDCMDKLLRYLWIKLHVHIINKSDEQALDCLYQLMYEFEAMGDEHDVYSLDVINFTFKPVINESEIGIYIKFLERNKQLSTVMELYEDGNFEKVLSILIESFEHRKNIAMKQEEEMSLDFAVQLDLILECFWALNRVEECFKWSLICLHESLKHYFLSKTNASEKEKWKLAVVKSLSTMEHILDIERLSCLDSVSQNDLSMLLEDLIRIIGHQIESNSTELPFDTVLPWIVMHYVLQKEDDQGRGKKFGEREISTCDEIPNPLLLLFMGHEQLGTHGWCCNSDAKLLYFILDTVVPRLRSPSLSKSLDLVRQYMEQCVYCLFGHPGKKNKLKHLVDHNVTSRSLDWVRGQQLYEIFRPLELPEVEGKVPSIPADTEQLFHRILALMPVELDVQKYLPDVEKFINGKMNKLPSIPPLLPYKMKDIYYILGDYYFKKEERKMSVKYNMFDVIVNSDRFESWAEIALAKGLNLDLMINSCCQFDNERDYLKPVQATLRCFQRALELDNIYTNLWIEYGAFAYGVHSFCSRLLKQASESLSMEDFEDLEKKKEEMLDLTEKSFNTVLNEHNTSVDSEKNNEDLWLNYFMLGKVAEKKNKLPSVYLNYYSNAVKSLQDIDATYPTKINYNAPQHLSIEVLELHYRIHASILKYIEQHENKPIPSSVGKIFLNCIEEWKSGPFTRKSKKEGIAENDKKIEEVPQPANIYKRSVSDAGEEDNQDAKRLKLESAAAKVRRSASYDTERTVKETKESIEEVTDNSQKDSVITIDVDDTEIDKNTAVDKEKDKVIEENAVPVENQLSDENQSSVDKSIKDNDKTEVEVEKKGESSSSSSSSSSESSSDDSSSDSSSSSSSDASTKTATDNNCLTEEEITNIISACLDALEDCASRFSQHYKAIYRLAHYHFYYNKGKDIERCRDLMLSNFTSRSQQKLSGLFTERKNNNLFNGIWRIPIGEVDRPGGFACHMSRCVLLTMEILKEIDDHKSLLEISLQLQKIPDPDKKYLRDADREDLAQQAFSLCVQSLKGQLLKFSQQADLKSNEIEKQVFNSFLHDIYKAYQKAQKQPNSKQFTNLLVEGYKLISTVTGDNINYVDLSMKHCQTVSAALKQQALEKSNQNALKKQSAKSLMETVKTVPVSLPTVPPVLTTPISIPAPTPVTLPVSIPVPTPPAVSKPEPPKPASWLPMMSAKDMASAFHNYVPMLNDPVLSQQTAAALSLSYLSNLSNLRAIMGYTALQNKMQNPKQSSQSQSSFQSPLEDLLTPEMQSFGFPAGKKQKLAKPGVGKTGQPTNTLSTVSAQLQALKSLNAQGNASQSSKSTAATTISHKPTSTPTPSSMLPNYQHVPIWGAASSSMSSQLALMANTSANTAAHKSTQGKTLQEKLAERQKNMPAMKNSPSDIGSSISRLPPSVTVTKTVNKAKKSDFKIPTFENNAQTKPPAFVDNEVIVLDDDD